MKLGTHISGGQEFNRSLSRAGAAGMTAVQCFPGNPMAYVSGVPQRVSTWGYDIHKVVHASYFPQLTHAPDNPKRALSINGVVSQLRWAEGVGATDLVIHAGSFKEGQGAMKAVEFAYRTLYDIFDRYDGPVVLCLETMAAKNVLGGDIDLLRHVVNVARNEGGLSWRVGICLDTAHTYAYGVSTDALEEWLATETVQDALRVVHLNAPNPIVEFGSHRDRHNVRFTGSNAIAHDWMRATWKMLREWTELPFIMEGSPDFATDREWLESIP
jgi:endonuclease IV